MSAKRFSLVDVVLSVICVVFTIEAVAPASAMGNVQFFWWGVLIVTFLLPYGMVVAELGSTFDSEGGLYDWVRSGLGDAWGSRCAWYYWVNFPLWIASVACIFPSVLAGVWGIALPLWARIGVELVFVWGVTWAACSPVSDADWILNGGAVIKVFITIVVGGVGVWFAVENGFANPMGPDTFLPDLANPDSLTYLSIILFNFMGFEVVATFAGSMDNPRRDIPVAIVVGGVTIAAVYILCGVGIGAAVPTEALNLDSGIVDAVTAMVGGSSPLVWVVGAAFLVTLFANMVSWSFGINSVACRAAEDGNMPRPFARRSATTSMPNGSALMTGVVASLVLLLQVPLGEDSEVFWVFFSMNVVFLLLSYLPMFPAFARLRRTDLTERVFRAPFGGRALTAVLAAPHGRDRARRGRHGGAPRAGTRRDGQGPAARGHGRAARCGRGRAAGMPPGRVPGPRRRHGGGDAGTRRLRPGARRNHQLPVHCLQWGRRVDGEREGVAAWTSGSGPSRPMSWPVPAPPSMRPPSTSP